MITFFLRLVVMTILSIFTGWAAFKSGDLQQWGTYLVMISGWVILISLFEILAGFSADLAEIKRRLK